MASGATGPTPCAVRYVASLSPLVRRIYRACWPVKITPVERLSFLTTTGTRPAESELPYLFVGITTGLARNGVTDRPPNRALVPIEDILAMMVLLPLLPIGLRDVNRCPCRKFFASIAAIDVIDGNT